MDLSISSATSSINSLASGINELLPASATIPPPSSQKAKDRAISFFLDSPSTNFKVKYDLVIRPEELTRRDVSRATVQQTLGGAWADDFGVGLATINISGHTGWRNNPNQTGDGLKQFAKLKSNVFNEYHSQKVKAIQAGRDPSKITLSFVDTLDSTADYVIPLEFTLRRSKSRPLLMQFNISMICVAPDTRKRDNPLPPQGFASFLASINNLLAAIKNIINFVKSEVAEITAFMQQVTNIFQTVTNLIKQVISIPQELLGAAKSMANAGATMFTTIANFPAAEMNSLQRAMAMFVASEFSNIHCLLHNTVNQKITYPDYTPLYGASNCSSTNGGSPISPYANTNPFYAVSGNPSYAAAPSTSASTAPSVAGSGTVMPVTTISATAKQALTIVNNSDPVLAPLSMTQIGVAASAIASGVSVVSVK